MQKTFTVRYNMKKYEEEFMTNYSSVLNSSILYYPSIEFPDDGFIKSSLCIWDIIYRIVPESYTPNDSDEIKIAVQEGAIKNIKLSKSDLNIASDGFMDLLTGSSFLPAGLEGYETIDLHKEKVDARLYPYLKELASQVTGDWLTLSEQVVHGYMLFLANSICQNRNIPKITDNPDVFSIMTYFENDGQFDEGVLRDNAGEYYSSIIIPNLIPAGVERTDIETVLRFREKTAKGRAEFRDTISGFTDELKEINDREYAREVTENFRVHLEDSKQSISETGKAIVKNFIPSFLTIGVPTQVSTLGLLGINGDPYSINNIMKSFFISSVAAFADGYSKSKSWKSQTASYYIGLKTTFEDGVGRISTPRFDRIFEEFIND